MKEFHISDVLSVTTPRLLSTRHIEGVYDILGFLSGEKGIFTHQLGRVNEEMKPWLRAQFPQLMEDSPEMAVLLEQFDKDFEVEVQKPEKKQALEALCLGFIQKVREKFGLPEYLMVYEAPKDLHTCIDPVEELKAMVGDKKVIEI